MNDKRVAILIDLASWLLPGAKELAKQLRQQSGISEVVMLDDHQEAKGFFAVFILSYGHIVPEEILRTNRHNVVVHESDLPRGRGWSPLTWQILEGKDEIPLCLFEASSKVDRGVLYLQDTMRFQGTELVDELRAKQTEATIALCLRFVVEYDTLVGKEQRGDASYYPRRRPVDSELSLDKTLGEQVHVLRVVDNQRYPAFFWYRGRKFFLRITAEGEA